jgi:predicted nuclease of predicted toxin-antitoxin system
MKFLIDEDLSPNVAQHLCRNLSIDAIAVRDRGLLSAKDYQVLEYAFREDRILVTANVCDFKRFASNREIHAGIIFICDGSLLRDQQINVVVEAIEAIHNELEFGRDMVNRVLYVEVDGTLNFQVIPSALSTE